MTSPWPEQFDLELELDSSEATVELQPVPAPPRRERPPRRTARGDLARFLAGAAGAARRRVTILREDIPAYERQRRALAAGVLLVLLIALLSTGGGIETAPPQASPSEAAAPEQAARAEAEPAALSLNAGTLLRPGDRSREVRRLQEALLALGLSKAKPDGLFGKKTTRAVKTFQRQAGLEADGVVGPKTAEALNRALAGLP